MRDDATLTEVVPPYHAPAWLVGGHAQTIWPYLLRRPPVMLRRERVETDDADFWDFDWLDAPPRATHRSSCCFMASKATRSRITRGRSSRISAPSDGAASYRISADAAARSTVCRAPTIRAIMRRLRQCCARFAIAWERTR